MFIAEREGFEPPVPLSTTVFKTVVIDFSMFIAVRTGLEPVTPCVTGMYSNQLN